MAIIQIHYIELGIIVKSQNLHQFSLVASNTDTYSLLVSESKYCLMQKVNNTDPGPLCVQSVCDVTASCPGVFATSSARDA